MSRFLAFAHPSDSVEEARAIVSRYGNEYHDARHVCWAYMIGADRLTFQSSDDGEPSGTAGKPILGQINSAGLTNVTVIVVRYFGGIKLGTSGLINAYREAARGAIAQGGVAEGCETESSSFTFPYLCMNAVMKVVKGNNLVILSQNFDNVCSLKIEFARDKKDDVFRLLHDAGALPEPVPADI